jgi:hypothetical protein
LGKEAVDFIAKLIEAEGLRDETCGPTFDFGPPARNHSGYHQYWNIGMLRMTIGQQAPAIADRHFEITDDKGGMLDHQDNLRGETIFRLDYPVTVRTEDKTDAVAYFYGIVDHQHLWRRFFNKECWQSGTLCGLGVSEIHARVFANFVPASLKF